MQVSQIRLCTSPLQCGATVIKEYTLPTVQEYMYHIRNNAEQCVRSLLRDVVKSHGTKTLSAIDYLDDGSPVSGPYLPLLLLSGPNSYRYALKWR